MDNKTFWDQRVKNFGHTGWADATIYSYDQKARLNAIRSIISDFKIPSSQAIDFGCGVGDFSVMLAELFSSVIACDLSSEAIDLANKRNACHNLLYCHTDEVKFVNETIDLFLSITVLGHIMDDDELSDLLKKVHKGLKEHGFLIAMEFAPKANDQKQSSYQRFRSFDEWISSIESHGFKLDSYYGFYHPTMAPCSSYQSYRKDLRVQFLNKIKRFYPVQPVLDKIALNGYLKKNDYYWKGNPTDPLKIMVFRKKAD